MSKRLSKYIACCDYFDKFLIVLSATRGSVSIASFATVIGTPVGIASASLSLTFSLSTGLVKKLLKTTRDKKKKHIKIGMSARSKLNSIERKVSEALIHNEISHEDFLTIINEERNYRELKESIRMMKGQEDKKIDTDYCLKCKENPESINLRVSATSNGRTMMLSKCTIYGSKKSKFIEEQQAKGLLSNLGIRTPLKIPLSGYILF